YIASVRIQIKPQYVVQPVGEPLRSAFFTPFSRNCLRTPLTFDYQSSSSLSACTETLAEPLNMPYVSVPPLSSPPFSYDQHSGFHIYDRDRGRVYKRHDPKELYALLTYDAEAAKYTKAGKLRKNPPKHTDETHHFYNAQLTHYGLSPTKSKQAAKVALLEAYKSENNLFAPPHILNLEENLRSQFRAKEAKLLREAISKRNEEYELEQKQRAKRKRQEDAVVAEIEEAIVNRHELYICM
ncbi:MAG: hypothetical protein Q9192_007963, partial [Flavoplaca navasiana]